MRDVLADSWLDNAFGDFDVVGHAAVGAPIMVVVSSGNILIIIIIIITIINQFRLSDPSDGSDPLATLNPLLRVLALADVDDSRVSLLSNLTSSTNKIEFSTRT